MVGLLAGLVTLPADMLLLRERRRRVALPASRTFYRSFARGDFSDIDPGAPIDHRRLQAALFCNESAPAGERGFSVTLDADDLRALETAPQLAGAAHLANAVLGDNEAAHAVTLALREYREAAIRSAWLTSRGRPSDSELDSAGARLSAALQAL